MSGSLRDALSEAFSAAEEQETAGQAPEAETPGDATVSGASASPAPAEQAPVEAKPGRTAGRERDEHGRLLPGPAKRPETAAPAVPAQQAPAPEVKPLARPNTLKKELWPIWDKLTKGEALTAEEARQKAEWILQRDSDYAKGVSTYKAEAEHARPLLEAIQPFRQTLDRYGINPAEHVRTMFAAHERLALGSPQEKLQMFAQLAQQYQVPLGGLFVQGQDGQIQFNQQLLQQAPQRQQQPQQDIDRVVDEAISKRMAAQTIAQMEKDEKQYPHFKTVKQDMGGLLHAGLAEDLDSAYQAAIRLPKHAALFEADQQQVRQQEEQQRREQAQAQAQRARSQAVSPRSATPTAAAAGTNGKKGLRDLIAENVEAVGGGRV